MGRVTTLIGALALVVTACGGAAAPSATPASAVVTAPPAVTEAPATAAPATAAPVATTEMLPVQVSFDGTTCTYEGPSTVPAGTTLRWTFANTPVEEEGYGAVLIVAPVVDGTTWEQINTEITPASVVPEWLKVPGAGSDGQGEIAALYDSGAAMGNTIRTTLTRDAYYVGCGTSPTSSDKAFPAILLKTLKG